MYRGLNFAVLLICYVSLPCIAYVYETHKMTMQSAGQEKVFVGLSDFHDKSNPANVTQLQIIEQCMVGCDKAKTKFAAEDLSSRNNKGRFACGHYFVNSRGGILGGLADMARRKGLDIDNIEFRYCRVTSLGPVLNNLHEPLDGLASVAGTRVESLIDEIQVTINDIRSYNDGPVLKKIYETAIRNVQKNMVSLKLVPNMRGTIAEYLRDHSTISNRLELLKKLLTFDSALLDIELVHSIVNAQDKTKFVAIAGGSHIVRVCELLAKIGYKKVNSTNIAYAKEYDLQRCLGSHIIEGLYCVKPRPIETHKLIEAFN